MEERARKTGVRPAALRKRPKLLLTDRPYADAFHALHTARSFGPAAPNPIPIQEVSAFCVLLGIAPASERAKYLRLIQLLDKVYLAHWAKANPPPGSTPTKGRKN